MTEIVEKGGIFLPENCPRCCTDCQPLSQVVSTCGKSFVCAGLNDGSRRAVPQDRFTWCFKNETVDEISHNDEQDFMDMLSVLAQALSADHHMRKDKDNDQ